MIFDLLDEFETKIEAVIDSITKLQVKLDNVTTQKNQAIEENESLKTHNDKLVESHQQWQSRLSSLVIKMEQVDDALALDIDEVSHDENHENHENYEHQKQHEHNY
ncbi:MAG: cell division protein ZapB [Psychromonas sp.]|nr:cell division protein ZapB [Psychromonas sp.]